MVRRACIVLFEASKGAVFFACTHWNCWYNNQGEKEGAGEFIKLEETFLIFHDWSSALFRPMSKISASINNVSRNTAPPWFSNNRKQSLLLITTITKSFFELLCSSCALALQKQRSICFCMPFSLGILSWACRRILLGKQKKEHRSLHQGKK